MPPFLSQFKSRTNSLLDTSQLKSRTNSLLDTITGSIPDSPPNGSFKDRSLTCRKCGNRFRNTLELSSHFNLLPHHSDYADSHNFDTFTRPKVRRQKILDRSLDSTITGASADGGIAPAIGGFSEAQAYYAMQDKENKDGRPTMLRKFPTFSSLTISPIGERQQAQSSTDYAEDDNDSPAIPTKGKGKQKALPRLRRDDSFRYGQPLASSDEEGGSQAPSSSSSNYRSRVRSASTQALVSESAIRSRPRSSTSSSASKQNDTSRQAPPLPPKLASFDWESEQAKPLANWEQDADDTASIVSDASFRTAGSTGNDPEKSRLRDIHRQNDASEQELYSSQPSSLTAARGFSDRVDSQNRDEAEARPNLPSRHASSSNLLLESIDDSHDDAPPSYHELHGDTDPFDDFAIRSRRTDGRLASRHAQSRSDGFATMPTSPVSHFDTNAHRRPRRATNAWPSSSSFPVSFSSADDIDFAGKDSHRRNNEDSLYSTPSAKAPSYKAGTWSARDSTSADATLPPLVQSSSFCSSPSPSTPKTPFAFFDDAPLTSPPLSLPRLQQPSQSGSGAGRKSRHTTRAKSDLAAPSTRCPTCFNKFASLDKTLEHLDNSDCGAVDFESGIM